MAIISTVMQTSPFAGVAFLLFLVLLVLAPIAITRSPSKLKAALHILAGSGSRSWNCDRGGVGKR
jgi:hypothetical protein